MGRLDGKVAVVTGGAGGIGAAAVRLFVAEGARVMAVDRDAAGLKALAAELGDAAATTLADVTSEADSERYVAETVARFGGLDIALLNAGIEGELKSIRDTPAELFDRVMAVNVRGVFLGLKAAMAAMDDRGGGSIVVTSSTSGIRATRNLAPYTASKHAVIGLMRSAALEGAARKIRVNTVNPSPIATRMIDSIEEMARSLSGANERPNMALHTPLQRYGTPEEVARLMLFLASDESSFCTDGVYMVDGGVSAGRP